MPSKPFCLPPFTFLTTFEMQVDFQPQSNVLKFTLPKDATIEFACFFSTLSFVYHGNGYTVLKYLV